MRSLGFLLLLILFSCNSDEKRLLPIESLIPDEYGKNNVIIYQYYEEYGFTDLCSHNRALLLVKDWTITKGWKPLPMKLNDIKKVNAITNKIDSLVGDSLAVIYEHKSHFSDIMLESEEYISDTISFQKMDLLEGYYRVDGVGSFEVYNPKNNFLYYEQHRCDEY